MLLSVTSDSCANRTSYDIVFGTSIVSSPNAWQGHVYHRLGVIVGSWIAVLMHRLLVLLKWLVFISCAACVCVVGVPIVFAKVFVLAKVLSVFVEAIRLGWGAFFLGEAT